MRGNPIIKHKFTADPTVIAYKDRVYLYCGHDEAPVGTVGYKMNEWLCFSSSDLVEWTEHPVPLYPSTFSWAKSDAYASKVIERDGKFYWYVSVTPKEYPGKAIGVAVSDNPIGPFKDAIGSPLIKGQWKDFPLSDNFDPSVLVDDDGEAYIFWGKNVCFFARLKSNLIDLDGEVSSVNLPDFVEGINIHKRNGVYYLSYGYGFPEKIGYSMSASINGPWKFMGVLNELAGNCETNRPAMLDFKGKSYFFYHNGGLENGGSHRRSICIDNLYYNPDATIKRIVMTSEGISPP
ncbi:MAG TPA: glycoside hydrolase family 43 protein [Chryseolinea sp.]|nr:glycoside hydrolase family 43 protein [Chryseolinea sp.]